MDLLTSETIINRLTAYITKDALLTSKEDPIQPIMDIVHGAIMKYDLETTRVGLKAVTDQVIKIMATENIDSGMEEALTNRFCTPLEFLGKLAISREDEKTAAEVIKKVGELGQMTAIKELYDVTGNATASLGFIGEAAAKRGLEFVTMMAVTYLYPIGNATADKPVTTTRQVVSFLVQIGVKAKEKEFQAVTWMVATYLAQLTFISENLTNAGIQMSRERLKEQENAYFQQFMELYKQELKKLQAKKKNSE